MAEIVYLPTVEPVTCGRLPDGIPVHVWSPDALAGDACACGASVLNPELVAQTLALLHA